MITRPSAAITGIFSYCGARFPCFRRVWLCLGARLIGQPDQHLPQLSRPGYALRKIQPQYFGTALAVILTGSTSSPVPKYCGWIFRSA
jgi:hypothetical protein